MIKSFIILLVLFLPIIKIFLISLSFGEGGGEAFAQIVIKERVEVLPQGKNYVSDDPTQSHTITAVMEWDTTGGTHNYLRARMNMINECTADTILSEYVYDGHIEISMSSTDAVRYEINTFTEARDYPYNYTWYPFLFGHSLKVYADGVLIYENPTFHNVGSTSIYYWRSDLEVRIASYSWNRYDDALCFGERARTYLTDEEDCQGALWNASENIPVSIIEGGEYTSFYYGGSELLGDNVTFSSDVHGNYSSTYGDIELKYDVEYTDTTADKLVILEAVVNGLTARDTIIIPKPEGYFLNGETEDGKERIVKWERLRINSWIEKGGMCEGITSPPEGTSFEAEIIQGGEFGGLVDTTTGETTQMLTGLTADENNIVKVEYFADGDSALTDEEITVRINSTIAGVEPLEVIFYASRSEIVVTTSPGELQAGEISDVYVYWYDEMNSLVLIPGDEPLQAEVIEGAELGDIYNPATGQYADYFDEIFQGFKFKAADEVDTSNARVLIRVSAMVGGGISSPQNQKGKTEEKLISNKDEKEVNGREPDFPFVEIYGIGSLLVGDECDFENCYWNYEDLIVLLNRQSNNFEYEPGKFITVCDLSNPNTATNDVGQSKPVPYERKRKELNWGNSWEIEPCISTDGRVQFSIVTVDRLTISDLYFDFVEAVCEDIITNPPNNGTIITDLYLNGITESTVKDAMNDFCGHQLYPIRTGTPIRGGYYIEEVIRVHEGIHGDRFYKILNNNKQMLLNELNKLILDCQEYENFWKVDGVEQHIINALNTYYQFCETEYFANNNEQEIQCHFAIVELIDIYMKQVNFRFKTKIPDIRCYKCKQ